VRAGFVGVDIFFVISGYLISSILYAEFGAAQASGGGVIRDFYSRRVRRIFPSLIVALVACYVLGYFLLLPGQLAKLSLQMVASAGFCLNILLSRETGYFNGDSKSNPLLHLWSLGVEEQFYLLWPIVIWAAIRCRARILPVAVFLAACSYFWNGLKLESGAAAAFFLPQTRLWEILIGAIAAAILPPNPQAPVRGSASACVPNGAPSGRLNPLIGACVANGLSLLGIALIGTGLSIMTSDMNLPNKWTLLPTLGAACIVCSGESAWMNRWILSNRVMVWIGLISYPLYLWHWPLLAYSRIAFDESDSVVLKSGAMLISGILAWLTYALVKRPIRRGRKPAQITSSLVGAMAVIVCLGFYSKGRGGFPARFPPLMQQISDWQYNPVFPGRKGTYFLTTGQQDERDFKVDPDEIVPGKPTLYLWGDSHAAALYAGLSDVYGNRYNIVERTVAVTPPFLGNRFNSGNGRRISKYVFDSIRRVRPEYVVLEADWERYEWEHVEETIVALRAAGVHHVVLVGPVPHWIGSLPQQLFNYIRKHRTDPVPTRMNQGLSPEAFRIDKLMAAMGRRLGVEYISPCAILGNQEGFLVRTGDTADSLIVYDSSHLTVSGSKYLVSRFPYF
jgi:peptidoglycan/LPS O-acetylase OafA/YrhL